MSVVRPVDGGEARDPVEGDVDEEEERVIEEEWRHQFENKTTAAWGIYGDGAPQLEWGGDWEIVQCGPQEGGADIPVCH